MDRAAKRQPRRGEIVAAAAGFAWLVRSTCAQAEKKTKFPPGSSAAATPMPSAESLSAVADSLGAIVYTGPSRTPAMPSPINTEARSKPSEDAVWCPEDCDAENYGANNEGGRWATPAGAAANPALLYTSYALAGVTMAMGLSSVGFVHAFRARPVMKLSQREFLMLCSLGFAVLGGSLLPFLAGIESPSRALCVAHDVLFNGALIFIMASILVKEWRAWRVFKCSTRMRRVRVRNAQLFRYIAALLLLPAALMVLSAAGVAGDPEPDPCNGFRCGNTPFVFALYAYELLLAAATVLMAVWAREVPSIGGEAVGILYTAFFSAFALLLVGIMFLSGALSLALEALMLTLAVCWCCSLALGSIVFRKARWLSSSEADVHALFIKSGGATSEPQSRASLPEDIHRANSGTLNSSGNGDGGARGRAGGSPWRDSASGVEDEFEGQTAATTVAPASAAETAVSAVTTGVAPRRSTATDGIALLGVELVLVKNQSPTNPPSSSEAVGCEVRSQAQSQSPKPGATVGAGESEPPGWKVRSRQGWDEFLDRSTGASYWVSQISGQTLHECPFSAADDGTGGVSVDHEPVATPAVIVQARPARPQLDITIV